MWGGSVASGRVGGKMRNGWKAGLVVRAERLWKRGEKKRTMGKYTYVYDAEREERKRMAEKRKYGLKKRAALIHEGRRGKNLLGVGFREEIWRFR